MTNSTSFILLTYKGKILLLMPDNRPTFLEDKMWSFIGMKNGDGESYVDAMVKTIAEETSIKLQAIAFISVVVNEDKKNTMYQAELTDADVNAIQRIDGKELQFFAVREIEKLPLAQSAKTLFSLHRETIYHSALRLH